MSVRDLCMGLLLGEDGQIVREDVIFHDILEKGTLLGTHTSEDGFSLKMYGYYWIPSIGGKHSLLKSQDITSIDNSSSSLHGIYVEENVTYTNQLVKYGSSGLRFGIYTVVCKNSIPVYAIVCSEQQGISEAWEREYDVDGKPFYYRQKMDFQVTEISGNVTIGLPRTFTDSHNADAVFVNGSYNCSGSFRVDYSYIPCFKVYDSQQNKYVVRAGTRQSSYYTVTCPNWAQLVPVVLSDYFVIYSDLDTEELITVFQELINAMRKEAEIDSIDIEIREPEE